MKKTIIFSFVLLVFSYCRSQDNYAGRGLSFSYSTDNAWGVDMFGRAGNNRFHLGYGHQFNNQEIKVVKKHKEIDGLTETGNGKYFWVIDLGYSRIFKNKITMHPEFSIGARNEFTNIKDDRGYVDDYSLVTNSNLITGIGLKVGYLMNNGLEPFIGIHTLKKIDFGTRLSW
ncbi:hypothetical protein [Gaetbulibacter saemankumensis]|uniref:hypothetical protein n=1 Tax=Gaetbulibacter saemankumensis TaxID=311208 RepID=UPI0003FD9562|nr:hypothetical protein [Gaetbulibacter saemankumensis]